MSYWNALRYSALLWCGIAAFVGAIAGMAWLANHYPVAAGVAGYIIAGVLLINLVALGIWAAS
ncbi:MAG TPA: hypothetical protein VGN15_14955 [Ktedonobacteraceae bacterium]|nr:hypothetical protein [Ktedonobacteraceae bacterium]